MDGFVYWVSYIVLGMLSMFYVKCVVLVLVA